LIRSSRAVAQIALAAVILVSCAKVGSGSFNGKPADIYAAGPSEAQVRAMFGDSNWWIGPPSFKVRPLDSATMLDTERFAVEQQFIHLGTAEAFLVTYTVYDTVTSATTFMTALKTQYGATTPTQKVGDDTLYLTGHGAVVAAPFIARIFARLGQIVVELNWSRKDGPVALDQEVKIAKKVIDGLQPVASGKVHGSLQPVGKTFLPPAGLDITYLGSTQLPIGAWTVMLGLALPGSAVNLLGSLGVANFAYGDYALNNDTHMEVQTALLTFPSPTDAMGWFTTFAPGPPDSSGISSKYVPIAGGTPASGEYHYVFVAGNYGAMLICKSSTSGEAATKECEDPVQRTAAAWELALGG
jgi:hypothetical protein